MTTTAPGRPRRFDTDAIIAGAMNLFWERGYRETSTRDLERALGLSQSSLYNAFGSKRGLLLAAIDRYEAMVKADLLGTLDSTDGLRAVDQFFAALGDWVISHEMRGCLVVSLMAGVWDDPIIEERVSEYRGAIRESFRTALADTGSPSAVEQRVEFLLAASFGVHSIARTSEPTEVTAMVDGIRSQISTWST